MSISDSGKWLKEAVFYQIYPQSFKDSNADGIGDIPGIIEKLDYIEYLGVNALWINPCFVSPFKDAGYDVADYYNVAPRYGTNADLTRLFKEAHRRGIRVLLDLVAGHTSLEHPWFKASCSNKRDRYSDRYIWTNSVWDQGDGSVKFMNGYTQRKGNFALNFFWCQPALNYGFAKPNPKYPWQQAVDAPAPRATRAELKRIMSFWLDKGADGFRVDMAGSLVKNDPDNKATIVLWREIMAWLDKKHPEVTMIAEWGNPSQAISAGFHLDFMLTFGVPGYLSLFFNEKTSPSNATEKRCFFDSQGEGTVCEFLNEYMRQSQNIKKQGYIVIPSGNHDFPRHSNGRTQQELKMIFTFLLTWPSVPFIYYGDEIGMRYMASLPSKEGGYERTGARTPMQWDDGKNAGFSEVAANALYLPVDPRKNRPTVKQQQSSPNSLLNYVRALIVLRKNTPALQASAKMIPVYAKPNTYPFVYLRQHGKKKYLVAINPAGREVAACFDSEGWCKAELRIGKGVHVNKKGHRVNVTMDKITAGVFELL